MCSQGCSTYSLAGDLTKVNFNLLKLLLQKTDKPINEWNFTKNPYSLVESINCNISVSVSEVHKDKISLAFMFGGDLPLSARKLKL